MIIGISGKLGSGKDLTGKIIQALTDKPTCFDGMEEITEEQINYKVWDTPKFENKKFADTLKDFVCRLIGCTREELEDREFKESELGPEWWRYKLHDGSVYRYVSRYEYRRSPNRDKFIEKFTPRKLLQLMGTECGREILHPNIWVNAVMSNYKPIDYISIPNDDRLHGESYTDVIYPNWVITDMRFPNELKAVEERGITIRVNRLYEDKSITSEARRKMYKHTNEHPSETALDNAEFDYVIENTGTIKDLVDKVREILIKAKII